MKGILNLRKQGNFYCSYEDDAYVLHSIMGYKVSNGKAGFPINSLGRVESMLEEAKVNYVIIEKNKENDKVVFNVNNYNYHLEKGKKSANIALKEQELFDKIDNLDEEKLDKIMNYIKEVINE